MTSNGRYLVIGFAGGPIPAIPLNLPLLKSCSLVGVFWGAHVRREPGKDRDSRGGWRRVNPEAPFRPACLPQAIAAAPRRGGA